MERERAREREREREREKQQHYVSEPCLNAVCAVFACFSIGYIKVKLPPHDTTGEGERERERERERESKRGRGRERGSERERERERESGVWGGGCVFGLFFVLYISR